MGDLNYRVNLSYEKVRELISNKDWPKLVERDQVGHTFSFSFSFFPVKHFVVTEALCSCFSLMFFLPHYYGS